MAVGEWVWPKMYPIEGVKLGVAAAGVKYADRNDLLVMDICEGASVAGVFTRNAFTAAPVTICKEHLETYKNDASLSPRFFVINSGNANACSGEAGYQAAIDTCEHLAQLHGLKPSQVLPFSTGVIGVVLPSTKINAAIPAALENASQDNWSDAAKAIMTTDTLPKGASQYIEWKGEKIHVTGISKGSGMINPNMGTMLAYIATDATITPEVLDKISRQAADRSFNRITIDGDTSTNDSCMLVATGKSKAEALNQDSGELFDLICNAVIEIYEALAQCIVRDGEGATKFVEVEVGGGKSKDECMKVAYAICHSPLVKTAMFASDPNWGRIVAAIGYAPVQALNADDVKIWLNDVLIVENGGCAATYTEEAGQKVFDQESFKISVDLGRGNATERLWTSDLSHEYIRINAEYRS